MVGVPLPALACGMRRVRADIQAQVRGRGRGKGSQRFPREGITRIRTPFPSPCPVPSPAPSPVRSSPMAQLASDQLGESQRTAFLWCAVGITAFFLIGVAVRVVAFLVSVILPSLLGVMAVMAMTKPPASSFDARKKLREITAEQRRRREAERSGNNGDSNQRQQQEDGGPPRRGIFGRVLGFFTEAVEDQASRLLASLGETDMIDVGIALVARTKFHTANNNETDNNNAGWWQLNAGDMLCVGKSTSNQSS